MCGKNHLYWPAKNGLKMLVFFKVKKLIKLLKELCHEGIVPAEAGTSFHGFLILF